MPADQLIAEARAAWLRRETEPAVSLALTAHAQGDPDGLALACSIALRGYRADLLVEHRAEITEMPTGVLRDGVLAVLQIADTDLDGAMARVAAICPGSGADATSDPLGGEGRLLPLLLAYLATGAAASAAWVHARSCIDAARGAIAAIPEEAAGGRGDSVAVHIPFDLLGLDALVELHTDSGTEARRALTDALAPLRMRNSLTADHALALICLGSVEHADGRLGEAAINLARGARLAPSWRPGVRVHGHVELAFVRIRQGRWRDAAEVVRRTDAPAESVEYDWLESQALAVHGLLLALQGDLEASGPVLERADRLCRDTPVFLAQMVLTHARIMVAITRSDWRELRRALDDAAEPGYRQPYRHEEWWMLTLLAAWHLERIDEFRSGVAEWGREKGAEASAYYWAYVSILAEYDERHPEAATAVSRALSRLSLDDDPLGRAWVRIVAGIYYSRFGTRGRPDPVRALAVYEEASAELTELGAAGLAARYDEVVAETTAELLRDAGGANPVARLTDQQRKVALAVGQGYTSGEIAGILHVSKRTVDYHVANIMRRLGVSSRREIARVLVVAP
ncbi:LuxR C-terminal-related transcriptional regulator [Microbacterium sp. cf332]|uniref:LuxR C-terminal-related transcriptional regulator n=1 Tax=Microbacterium sp. cf332 TaxID=1761804 RepID=UPI00088BE9F3|nr:LuxR C-terminal-related transcriptional regulator [Microbacterium sp. cf332]SDQ94237.1 regulatory protein, luxR family [Microbacterium sp. cf332]